MATTKSIRPKVSLEQFQGELKDVKSVLRRLGLPLCTDLGELIDLIELAVGDEEAGVPPNAAQTRILMAVISGDQIRAPQDDRT